jgi:hypothetical protein
VVARSDGVGEEGAAVGANVITKSAAALFFPVEKRRDEGHTSELGQLLRPWNSSVYSAGGGGVLDVAARLTAAVVVLTVVALTVVEVIGLPVYVVVVAVAVVMVLLTLVVLLVTEVVVVVIVVSWSRRRRRLLGFAEPIISCRRRRPCGFK